MIDIIWAGTWKGQDVYINVTTINDITGISDEAITPAKSMITTRSGIVMLDQTPGEVMKNLEMGNGVRFE